ncbi:MAG: TRAP transporter TatT component family protein [Myxococcales bacterium]
MRTKSDIFWVSAVALFTGCSPGHVAEVAVANALSSTSDTFSSDDDPKLIASATPFALKTMESLLADLPRHERLLRALASDFTGYTYAFVQQEADEEAASDPERAEAAIERARRLFLRARGYGLRGLDVAHPGLGQALLEGQALARRAALAETVPADVPLMYWTGAAWALAIADGKDQLQLVGQFPAVADLMDRAIALDADWDCGTLQGFFVSFDAARGRPEQARAHYERALALDHGQRLGVRVAYAEAVLVPKQDRAGFVKLLNEVLAFDVDAKDAHRDRLANIIAQHRARWLLARVEDLFV